jgi:subtilase family serine protease
MRRGESLSSSLLAVVVSLYFLACSSAQAENVGHVQITQNVDEAKLVTLSGNTRPEANAKNDRGLVANSLSLEHMLLQLKSSPERERESLQLVEELTDPSSPNFHHWLTAEEFGERFGVAEQDRDAIKNWLQSHHFDVNVDYTNGLLIDFSGTAGQVREAFHTEIHELNVKGVKHIANMSDPQIPAALAPAVVGVVSLNDFKPHAVYTFPPPYPICSFSGGICYAVVPADLATIYNLNPLFSEGTSGRGQTIVMIEDSDVYNPSQHNPPLDWSRFRTVFGLSTYTHGSFTQMHPNNCSDPGTTYPDEKEASLDAEYASAAAPNAAIVVASCSSLLIALQNLLNGTHRPPSIMSISYEECEFVAGLAFNTAYNAAYKQAAMEGVSVFVAAGDFGAADCDWNDPGEPDVPAMRGIGVNALASTVYNVAVGGTDFGDTAAGTNGTYWNATSNPETYYVSAKSYIPEIPWNDSCASVLIAQFVTHSRTTKTYGADGFCNMEGEGLTNISAGGGGHSIFWPKPYWQSLFGNGGESLRDIPDVSLFAANGIWGHFYPFCWSDTANKGASCAGTPDTWSAGGGTSFAAPIMAGIQALVNQHVGESQGNPNPVYYSLAGADYGKKSVRSSCNSNLGSAVSSSCTFHDVTLGDMDVVCDAGSVDCYLGSPPSGTNGVLFNPDSSTYQPAYGATKGWDFATGIGTVNAFNLVHKWSSTALASSLNASTYGQKVTFTATVAALGSATPTGNVNFMWEGYSIGTRPLDASGIATLKKSYLSADTYPLVAVYPGDANNPRSTSPILYQVVEQATSTATITSSANPSTQGEKVTFSATIISPTVVPTGPVTFTAGRRVLGTAQLGGGKATFTTRRLAVGSTQVTATYYGDSNIAQSAASLTQTVQ